MEKEFIFTRTDQLFNRVLNGAKAFHEKHRCHRVCLRCLAIPLLLPYKPLSKTTLISIAVAIVSDVT